MYSKIWIESIEGQGCSFIFDIELVAIDVNESNIKKMQDLLMVDEVNQVKKGIEPLEIDSLFVELFDAAQSKRPVECYRVISDLDEYELNSDDKKLFMRVKTFIKSYNFKSASQALKER